MLKRAIARVPVLIGHGVGFKSSCWLSHLQIRSEISAYFKLRKKKEGKKETPRQKIKLALSRNEKEKYESIIWFPTELLMLQFVIVIVCAHRRLIRISSLNREIIRLFINSLQAK